MSMHEEGTRQQCHRPGMQPNEMDDSVAQDVQADGGNGVFIAINETTEADLELVAEDDDNLSVRVPRQSAIKNARLIASLLGQDSTATKVNVPFDARTTKRVAAFLAMDMDRAKVFQWMTEMRYDPSMSEGDMRAMLQAANYLDITFMFDGIVQELVFRNREKSFTDCLDFWRDDTNGLIHEPVLRVLVTRRLQCSAPRFDEFYKAMKDRDYSLMDLMLKWLLPGVRAALVEDALLAELSSASCSSQTIAVLVRRVENPAMFDEKHRSPLHVAIALKNVAAVCELAKVCDVDERSWSGDPLLHIALQDREEAIVAELLEFQADPNARNASGLTALHIAVENDLARFCKLLVEFDADVNAGYEEGSRSETALHVACRKKSHKIARLLLLSNADVNAIDRNGDTPLHIAVRNNDPTLVDILIRDGFLLDINAVDLLGRTALIIAAESEFYALGAALSRAGADANPVDSSGRNALAHLIERSPFVLAPQANQQPMASSDSQRLAWILSRAVHDLNARIGSDATLLEKAIRTGNSWMVDLLLRAGADPNVTSSTGTSVAFLAATMIPDSTVLETLLVKGACHRTALEDAITQGDINALNKLVKAGNPDDMNSMVNAKGQDLLSMAISVARIDIVKVLIAHGIRVGNDVISLAESRGDTAMLDALRNGATFSKQ
ncbi:Ankyrin repeat domain-containing protein [Plasmodiophora brassicae]|nr:unnamed protein product [Plasmodiophora brassicae]